MDTKLTLTMEHSVIAKAKIYAKNREHSLSDLIENYLKSITSDVSPNEVELTPIVKSLKGAVKAPENFDYNYKKLMEEIRTEKYL
ncbi:hypothetical protein FACS189474_2760 [Bacteroidia bacterium]|nr:hypothetical protein FACS189440_12670 [Bacteroidia bacterium]GHT88129.1 hypothetical protein FACS189474_2760 [Bacteroidia bacterium]